MSETDNKLRRSLDRVAARQDWDVDRALTEVQDRGYRASVRRRRAVLLSVVAAVAAVVLLAGLATLTVLHRTARPEPASPPHPSDRSLFRVVRTLEPHTLGLRHVLRVAVSPRGYLVATDRSQHVVEMTLTGRVLRVWGSPGASPGEFRLQSGSLAVGADGRIYVSDTGNSRVQVFSPVGRYLTSFGGYGSGVGKLLEPRDIALDPSGDVYVADDANSSLTKFSARGTQIWRLDRLDTSHSDLYGHFHFVGLDRSGDLVTANDDAGRIIWLGSDGTEIAGFGSGASSFRSGGASRAIGEFPHGACGASTDPAGRLYVISCQEPWVAHHDLEIFDDEHHLIGQDNRSPFATAPVFLRDGTAVFVTPHGVIAEARPQLPQP